MRKVAYPHPGEILHEEFLKPMGITKYRIAKEIGVPQRRIGEIVAGVRGVTADTGLRLSRFFAMSTGFWIGLQLDYDAAIAKDLLAETLAGITPWQAGKAGATAARLRDQSRDQQRLKAPPVKARVVKAIAKSRVPADTTPGRRAASAANARAQQRRG